LLLQARWAGDIDRLLHDQRSAANAGSATLSAVNTDSLSTSRRKSKRLHGLPAWWSAMASGTVRSDCTLELPSVRTTATRDVTDTVATQLNSVEEPSTAVEPTHHQPSIYTQLNSDEGPSTAVEPTNQPYTVHRESKKTRHQTLGHNFTNYNPIFKFFSLADSVVNLQQIHV